MAKTNYTINSCKFIEKISDHYPVLIKFNAVRDLRNDKFYKLNYNKIIKLCYETNWNELKNIKDVNVAITKIVEKINSICEMSKMTMEKNNKLRKNWITPAIVNSCNRKNKLFLLHKSNPDDAIIKKTYNDYQNKLRYIINYAKLKYEKSITQKSDAKGLWNFVNLKLNRLKKDTKIDHILINGNKATDYKLMADHFNCFFASIGTKTANNLTQPINSYNDYNFGEEYINQNLFLIPTYSDEIYNIILNLKNKIGGIDGIHAITLKKIAPFISPVLAHIFNRCFETGQVPDLFKVAEIVPIFKNGKRNDSNNYRPTHRS